MIFVFNKGMCKKGAVIDSLPLMMLLLIFGVCAVFGYVIFDGARDAGLFTTLGPASSFAENAGDNAYTAMDWMSGLLFVGASIASIVGALLIRSHPAFFFLGIIILMLQVVVGVVLSNTWDMIITQDIMNDAETNFVVLGWVLGNLPMIVLVISLILAVVIYAVNPFNQ